MEQKDKRGGKRKGAGRKPLAGSKKVPITVYVEQVNVIKFGGAEKLKESLKNFADGEIAAQPLPAAFDSPKLNVAHDEPLNLSRPQIALKSFEQWQKAKRECENEEDWETIKAGIMTAPNLSTKQKDLLIKYS